LTWLNDEQNPTGKECREIKQRHVSRVCFEAGSHAGSLERQSRGKKKKVSDRYGSCEFYPRLFVSLVPKVNDVMLLFFNPTFLGGVCWIMNFFHPFFFSFLFWQVWNTCTGGS
jgi:hypothetical protein